MTGAINRIIGGERFLGESEMDDISPIPFPDAERILRENIGLRSTTCVCVEESHLVGQRYTPYAFYDWAKDGSGLRAIDEYAERILKEQPTVAGGSEIIYRWQESPPGERHGSHKSYRWLRWK